MPTQSKIDPDDIFDEEHMGQLISFNRKRAQKEMLRRGEISDERKAQLADKICALAYDNKPKGVTKKDILSRLKIGPKDYDAAKAYLKDPTIQAERFAEEGLLFVFDQGHWKFTSNPIYIERYVSTYIVNNTMRNGIQAANRIRRLILTKLRDDSEIAWMQSRIDVSEYFLKRWQELNNQLPQSRKEIREQ